MSQSSSRTLRKCSNEDDALADRSSLLLLDLAALEHTASLDVAGRRYTVALNRLRVVSRRVGVVGLSAGSSGVGVLGSGGIAGSRSRSRIGGGLAIGTSIGLIRLGNGNGLLVVVVDAGRVDLGGGVVANLILLVGCDGGLRDGVLARLVGVDSGCLDDGLGLRAMGFVRGVGGGDGGRLADLGGVAAIGDYCVCGCCVYPIFSDGFGLVHGHIVRGNSVCARLRVGGGLGGRGTIRVGDNIARPFAVPVLLHVGGLITGLIFLVAVWVLAAIAVLSAETGPWVAGKSMWTKLLVGHFYDRLA